MRRIAHVRSTALFDVPFGAYERHLLRGYALAAFLPEVGKRRRDVSDELVDWYKANRRMLGYRIAPLDAILERTRSDREFPSSTSLRYTSRNLPTYDGPAPAPSALQKRLDWAAGTLRLNGTEKAFLGAVVRLTYVRPFCEFYEAAMEGRTCDDEVQAMVAARMAGLTEREGRRLASYRSPLMQLGLLEDRSGGDVAVSATLIDLLATRTCDPIVLRRSLLGEATTTNLTLSDFRHLGMASDNAMNLLSGALSRGERGASLLFYGAPGTGKTEFAKLIGAEIGADVVFIGERRSEVEDSRLRAEPSRADRLSHLAFASALAERAGHVVLIIDEADDVFTGVDDEEFSNRSGSKVFMNRIVEACPVPMIWITNHPDRLGDAVLRRMLYAVEFREADRTTRQRIVERHAKEKGVPLAQGAIDRLASLPAAPALLETGIRAAALAAAEGDKACDLAIAVTRSLLKVAGRDRPPESPAGPMAFDANLSNADTDLAELERQVAATGPAALSFLFSGLPGTGKSAFARHLAKRLGLEVLEKRGSDLLGMFVGETEKRIADAFAEAADTRRFLIFDEADSLLADRAGAHQNWEVGQVNEMLTWMERHPAPFAATTNLAARLDPATQRRFLFKVTFGAMTSEQASSAFRRAFGVEAPLLVKSLAQLTPGDFAVVARQAKVLDIHDPTALARLLELEVLAKPGTSRRIGF